jgi:hypothetical protein
MPVAISNRNIGSGNGSLMVPIVANNPAFKVEILPVDGRLEQKPFAKDGSSTINAIKIGDGVRGDVVNSKETVEGKVLQINRQNGEIVSYKVLTADGDEVLLDPTTTDKYIEHGEEVEAGAGIEVSNTGPRFEESHKVLGYDKWLYEKRDSSRLP